MKKSVIKHSFLSLLTMLIGIFILTSCETEKDLHKTHLEDYSGNNVALTDKQIEDAEEEFEKLGEGAIDKSKLQKDFSFSNHMKKSNISIGELKSLTTIELLEKVLDYEHLPLLHMHNELQAGIDALEKNYNGLSELLNRKDVAEVVAEKYLKIEVLGYSPSATLIEKGKYALGITFLETLLAQQSVRNGFSQALKSQVGQKMIYNIETKSQDPEVYAFYSKVPTALVISRMLKDDNYGGFLSKTSSNVELSTFIEKGQIPSETTIETILSAGAKAYSK